MGLTLGSLFDGIGGWLLAAKRNGITPIWSSEIDKFAMKVSKTHFPDVKQLGDVTKLNGGEILPVDIICAGSPCQDLSVAGCRKGLQGERSNLFYEAIRITKEMRVRTNGKYPTFFVWENVAGAFSSNHGKDFQSVLGAITQADMPMPKSGRWAKAGMVRSKRVGVAWRTLDAQYWGVPQRRRRIFLVADYTDGGGAEEILFKPEVLPGYLDKGKEKRCQAERNPGGCIEKTSELCLNDQGGSAMAQTTGHVNTLRAEVHHPPIVFDMTHACDVIRTNVGVCQSLQHRMGTGGNQVPLTYDNGNVTLYQKDGKVGTLMARDYKGIGNDDVTQGKIIISGLKLRRLTPLECERLQGLPDNWTLIDNKTCSDSARYKAIGNGMAQPCADFILARVLETHREERENAKS